MNRVLRRGEVTTERYAPGHGVRRRRVDSIDTVYTRISTIGARLRLDGLPNLPSTIPPFNVLGYAVHHKHRLQCLVE